VSLVIIQFTLLYHSNRLFIFSHFRLRFLFHLTFILWCSPRLCLGSHPFHIIYVSTIVSIVSSCVVNQHLQYRPTDVTQLFLSQFVTASLSNSLRSLQQSVSSLHSWFLHNGLNPTKTQAIFFGTNPIALQSNFH